MSRRVDEVQFINLSVARLVVEGDTLSFDRDTALALEIHRIEHLLGHFAVSKAATILDEPIGKCRLAVIDVRDDRKIPDIVHVGSLLRILESASRSR